MPFQFEVIMTSYNSSNLNYTCHPVEFALFSCLIVLHLMSSGSSFSLCHISEYHHFLSLANYFCYSMFWIAYISIANDRRLKIKISNCNVKRGKVVSLHKTTKNEKNETPVLQSFIFCTLISELSILKVLMDYIFIFCDWYVWIVWWVLRIIQWSLCNEKRFMKVLFSC